MSFGWEERRALSWLRRVWPRRPLRVAAQPSLVAMRAPATRSGPVIFNSLTGVRQRFEPHQTPFSWYICGPTVYDDAHLGHARTYVCFDVIRRVMRDVFGMDSVLAMGVTDVDDKIIARAQAERRAPRDVAKQYEQSFMASMQSLRVERSDFVLRVTDHIDEIIAFISDLRTRRLAYTAGNGDVVFDTDAFHARPGCRYGKLQPANFGADQRQAHFALWKAGDEPGASWASPWGPGRPGWHIECSAMATSVFGDDLEVHGGGIDLKFPHHNNEMAQSEARSGVDWVRHWWHTGHLHVDGVKMSKSLRNFVTVNEFLDAHTADQFRMLCLLHRYRSTIQYSADRIRDADAVLSAFREVDRRLREISQIGCLDAWKPTPASRQLQDVFIDTKSRIVDALADDFDTPAVISRLLHLICKTNTYANEAGVAEANRPLLCNIRAFLQSQLCLFGVDTGAGFVIGKTRGADRIAVDILMEFRSSVRDEALRIQRSNGAIADRLLSVCDAIRDRLRHQAGIEVNDYRDRPSSWSIRSAPDSG